MLVFVNLELTVVPRRSVTFDVRRSFGRIGNVSVSFSARRETLLPPLEDNPVEDLCISHLCNATIVDGEGASSVINPIPPESFLEEGQQIVITLGEVTLLNPDGVFTTEPRVDTSRTRVVAPVEPEVADNVIRLSPSELRSTEGSVLPLTITRGSLLGAFSVDWEIVDSLGNPSVDVRPSSGSLNLGEGEDSSNLAVLAVRDQAPEPAEVFTLRISNPSGANPIRVRDTELNFLIEESNDPRGIFEVSNQAFEEAAGAVNVIIRRSGGTLGRTILLVNISGDSATEGDDFQILTESVSPGQYQVDFADGQAEAMISLLLFDDEDPEVDETIRVSLTSVVSVDPAFLEPRIGSQAEADVIILQSDSPFGLLGFQMSSVAVNEQDSVFGPVMFRVFRDGGSFGQVTVDWTSDPADGIIASGTDTSPDFRRFSGTLTFAPGEIFRDIAIVLVDDVVPEPAEMFNITLRAPSGGAELGANTSLAVTIQPSDDPNGVIGFELLQRTVAEDTTEVLLSLTRTGASFEDVTVSWSVAAADGSTFSSDDITALSGVAVIPAGSQNGVANITLVDDALPEFAETFVVNIDSVGAGATIDEQRRAMSVTIDKSDGPNGIFGFPCEDRLGAANADGRSVDQVVLTIERAGGTIGEVSVIVETVASASTATEFTSYTPIVQQEIVFPDGVTLQTVVLNTRPLPAGSSSLTVALRLSRATGGAQVDSTSAQSLVTIYDSSLSKEVLLDSQALECDPELYVDRAGSRSLLCLQPLTQSHVDGMLVSARSLLNGQSGSTSSVRRSALAGLFSDLLDDRCNSGQLDFRDAGELLEQFTTLLSEDVLEDRCPARQAANLGAETVVDLVRFSEGSEFNGYVDS